MNILNGIKDVIDIVTDVNDIINPDQQQQPSYQPLPEHPPI